MNLLNNAVENILLRLMRPGYKQIFFVCLLYIFLPDMMGQDTLYLPNGNLIDGEIKNMENGLLKISADYGDKDFIIEWGEIKQIFTTTYFFIYKSDGAILYGWLRSVSDSTIHILAKDGEISSCKPKDILKLREMNEGFRNRFNAGFDVGMALAKANNMRKYTVNANAGYHAEKWYGKAYVSALGSTQDYTEPVRRFEGHADYRYLFYKDWALDPSINFLSSTEQKLELRSSLKLGIGKYILRKSYGYWGVGAGVNRNMEQFSNDTPDRDSWEGFFGTEVNLFDVKDLDFFAKATAFPSITENGRWRVDMNFNVKYDLPLDFYVKLDFTMNYDNQPADEASETDYVLQLGFGWSW